MRTLPRTGTHTPTMSRASDDLPDALGPMMPSACPAFNTKLTSCTTTRCTPGGAAATLSTIRFVRGAGSVIGSPSCASTPSNSDRRRQLWRADTKAFQLAIASSTGASARETRIELAMMMPAVACCWMTR